MGGHEQSSNVPELQPVGEMLAGFVVRQLCSYEPYIMHSSWGEFSVDTLHMISPSRDIGGKSVLVGYHFVYDSLSQKDDSHRLGVRVANPNLGQNYSRNNTSREYFMLENQLGQIVCIEKDQRRVVGYKEILGTMSDIHESGIDEPTEAKRILKHDLLLVERAAPLRPMSNKANLSLALWDVIDCD